MLLHCNFTHLFVQVDDITPNEDEIAAMYNHLRTFIDETIKEGDTMSILGARPKLKEFFAKHVKSRHYMFSIKKCGEDSCSVCFPPRTDLSVLHHLPDPEPDVSGEHYKPFKVRRQ